MIHNPDPSKYRVKKLRSKGYVLVPITILRRRKRNIKIVSPLNNKQKLGRPKAARKANLLSRKFFE